MFKKILMMALLALSIYECHSPTEPLAPNPPSIARVLDGKWKCRWFDIQEGSQGHFTMSNPGVIEIRCEPDYVIFDRIIFTYLSLMADSSLVAHAGSVASPGSLSSISPKSDLYLMIRMVDSTHFTGRYWKTYESMYTERNWSASFVGSRMP